MKILRLVAVPLAVAALFGGATTAQPDTEGSSYNLHLLPCAQVPILPIPILSLYQHPADCSKAVTKSDGGDSQHH
ncbi:hypothetical protein QWJ26_11315 [Streptomyces sp. CSDS2]|uniref:hypothetical protein n=1 Tax=Streptomyces sp. CSDS2 TaxID=3055051 RepID=UPI0025B15D24|nr:hypothetical protein [Streptomyces sp. CSDS2]MDN3260391.1 hypothetical protein [Streptomyces sp. CSDS2]